MSKIDDTIAAIKTAEENLSEVMTAINAAVEEAEEAKQVLMTGGAEGSANLMAKAQETLESAIAAAKNVSDLLEEATSAAQEAV